MVDIHERSPPLSGCKHIPDQARSMGDVNGAANADARQCCSLGLSQRQDVSWRPARRDWRNRTSPAFRASGMIARQGGRKLSIVGDSCWWPRHSIGNRTIGADGIGNEVSQEDFDPVY